MTKTTPPTLVNIEHIFDPSLSARPDLNALAHRAAEFLDRESDNQFEVSITWAVADFKVSAEFNGHRLTGSMGPLQAVVRDKRLDIMTIRVFSLDELNDEGYRYNLLRMWSQFLMARTAKLHDLVFNSDEQKDAP